MMSPCARTLPTRLPGSPWPTIPSREQEARSPDQGMLPIARGGRRLAPGDHVHVDAERACLPDDPGDVGAAAGELLPAAAPAGSDHDLGDLMLPREPGDGPGGIVVVCLVPAGADVG